MKITHFRIEFGLFVYYCSIRDITAEVGASVVRAAVAEEVAEGYGNVDPGELAYMSKVWNFSLLFTSSPPPPPQ